MPLLNLNACSTIAALIGQDSIKKTLSEFVIAWSAGGSMENFGLYGGPGMGKTEFLFAFGRELQESNAGIRCFYLNCKGTLNKTSQEAADFFEFCHDSLSGKFRGFVILDECFTKEAAGSLNSEIAAILSKVGGSPLGGVEVPLYGFESEPVIYYPQKLAFSLCTWFPRKAAADIKTRFPEKGELRFVPYTAEELAEILKLQLERFGKAKLDGKAIGFTDYAIAAVARALRGTARQAEAVCQYAVRQCQINSSWKLSKVTAADAMKAADIVPHGLSALECKILVALDSHLAGYTVTELLIKTNATREDIGGATLYLQEQLGNSAAPFQFFNVETGEPLTYIDEKGNEYLQAGALVVPKGNRFTITLHGRRVVAILRKSGFVK
jgi:DNA polymerase III delta prime subunit